MLNFRFSSIRLYSVATAVSGLFFGLTAGYSWLQFGKVDAFIANRALGETSLLLLCLVLLIGPLTRLFDKFDRWLLYRKELGILAFVTATAHWLISGLALPGRSWAGFFTRNPQSFYTGSFALAAFAILFLFSFEIIVRRLPRKLWWALQNWGVRLAGVLVIVHVYLLRQAAWITWFNKGGTAEMVRPFLPPITVMTGIIVAGVVLIRFSEFLGKQAARMLVTIIFLTILAGWAGSIAWSYSKTPHQLTQTVPK